MALFTTAYFPSISYVKRFLAEDDAKIEVWETYHKQSIRTRCQVMTANGVQALSVPVVKVNGNHTLTKDIAISYKEHWQQIHRRCLESGYKASPYFDHYYPYIATIFETRYERLIELNDAALKAVFEMLKVKKEILHTADYAKTAANDFRNAFSDKGMDAHDHDVQPYYQVFSTKFKFVPDLSILDLIFNEGPESKGYLIQDKQS